MRALLTLSLSGIMAFSLMLSGCEEKKEAAAENAAVLEVKVDENAEGKVEVKAGSEKLVVDGEEGKVNIQGAFGSLKVDSKTGAVNLQLNKDGDEDEEAEKKAE